MNLEGSTKPVPVLGLPERGYPDDSDGGDDIETNAAIKYIQSVRDQSASLPFVVEADMEVEVASMNPGFLVCDGRAVPDLDLVVCVLEYFYSLRELVLTTSVVEKVEIKIDFSTDELDICVGADFVSVCEAIETLSDSLGTLSADIIADWMWSLLVYCDVPVLEDTGAALQANLRLRQHPRCRSAN
jgi:hypothetical protein